MQSTLTPFFSFHIKSFKLLTSLSMKTSHLSSQKWSLPKQSHRSGRRGSLSRHWTQSTSSPTLSSPRPCGRMIKSSTTSTSRNTSSTSGRIRLTITQQCDQKQIKRKSPLTISTSRLSHLELKKQPNTTKQKCSRLKWASKRTAQRQQDSDGDQKTTSSA